MTLSSSLRWTRTLKQALPRPCKRASTSSKRLYSTKPSETPFASSDLPKPRLDYRDISDNVVYKSHNAFNRKAPLPLGSLQTFGKLYEDYKHVSSTLNAMRSERSAVGDDIRRAASQKDEGAKQTAMERARSLKDSISALEKKVEELEESLLNVALAVPNDTHPSSPIGPESAAVVLSSHGPAPTEASSSRDHLQISRTLRLIDFEAGATTTGSSWYYLLGQGALLELALTNYAMSVAVKRGYRPVVTPDIVRSDIAYRCGFQPRDHLANPPVSQMYHIAQHSHEPNSGSPELVLSGTAEIPLGGLFANQVLPASEPVTKLVGVGHSFRSEAGARGADTRGLYRVHQFTKVELFVVCNPDQASSLDMMEEMKNLQVEIFDGLGLPFRILDMPTEELGASAYRKYDIEAWMPGRDSWGEISSLSNCTDYQSRRLNIRYRRSLPSGDETLTSKHRHAGGLTFAHTLNGTAAAIPRLIVALLENGAQFDDAGHIVGIALPTSLRPFWLGQEDEVVRWI